MKIIGTVEAMRAASRSDRRTGRRIAFVPTMGALHAGHMSLVEAARDAADVVVVSIFVNPTQFGPAEDFGAYPRPQDADLEKCRNAGVDVVFCPAGEDVLYRRDASVVVTEARMSKGLCGAVRPGHFDGVLTIVTKLFNIVEPDIAVFGEKDAQQLALIRRLARDLDIPVSIVACPTVREDDGLAMSSRNHYLSADERKRAAGIAASLRAVEARFLQGELQVSSLKAVLSRGLTGLQVQYAEIVDAETLEPVVTVAEPALCAVAVLIGETRLIDNIVLSPARL